MEDIRNIIVIGASAGGFPAINKVVAGLSNKIDAAVFVVWHVSPKSNAEVIVRLLQKQTSLIVSERKISKLANRA